jgi:hypothetical protein
MSKPLYYFYRMLPSGKWKYTEAFNSTLDPEYHALINECNANKVSWKLVSTYDNTIKYQELYGV